MDTMLNEQKMKYRMFKIIAMTAIIANSIGFIFNVLIFGMAMQSIVCVVCGAIMILMAVIGWKSSYWNICMVIILLIINCFEFPYLFYEYGFRTIVYMVLGFCGAVIYSERQYRHILAILLMIYDVAVIKLSYQLNAKYWVFADGDDIISTSCSLLIVLGSIYAIIVLWTGFNKEQNRELVELNNRLRHISESDALTGAYNRHFLTQYLEKMIKASERSFHAVLIDIDNFKRVNDTYGHVVGDKVLINLCAIIKTEIAEKDILARFGGEEFLIIFQTADKKLIDDTMKRIAERFWQYGLETNNEGLSFSGGVAEYGNEDELTKLYNNADEKLYTAKRNGKNQIVW